MRFPPVGESTPTRGNRATTALGRTVLACTGWSIEGRLPDTPRLVAIVAPHTSNWDFVLAIAGIFALDLKMHWIGKHTIFRRPFGSLMRWLGGIPVRRSAKEGLVAQTAAAFNEKPRFILGLAPEGTRKRVAKWRTGFYHIAVSTRASILLITIDYATKSILLGPVISPTGDLDLDAPTIRQFYSGRKGRNGNPTSEPVF